MQQDSTYEFENWNHIVKEIKLIAARKLINLAFFSVNVFIISIDKFLFYLREKIFSIFIFIETFILEDFRQIILPQITISFYHTN